jgi:hypothetical protein
MVLEAPQVSKTEEVGVPIVVVEADQQAEAIAAVAAEEVIAIDSAEDPIVD